MSSPSEPTADAMEAASEAVAQILGENVAKIVNEAAAKIASAGVGRASDAAAKAVTAREAATEVVRQSEEVARLHDAAVQAVKAYEAAITSGKADEEVAKARKEADRAIGQTTEAAKAIEVAVKESEEAAQRSVVAAQASEKAARIHKTSIEPDSDNETLWKIYALINSWISHADQKIGLLLATNALIGAATCQLVAIDAHADNQGDARQFVYATFNQSPAKYLAGLSGLCLFASVYCCLHCVAPRLHLKPQKNTPKSPLYFMSLSEEKHWASEGDNLLQSPLLSQQLSEQLTNQIFATSMIAREKYKWTKRAVHSAIAALSLALIACVCSAWHLHYANIQKGNGPLTPTMTAKPIAKTIQPNPAKSAARTSAQQGEVGGFFGFIAAE